MAQTTPPRGGSQTLEYTEAKARPSKKGEKPAILERTVSVTFLADDYVFTPIFSGGPTPTQFLVVLTGIVDAQSPDILSGPDARRLTIQPYKFMRFALQQAADDFGLNIPAIRLGFNVDEWAIYATGVPAVYGWQPDFFSKNDVTGTQLDNLFKGIIVDIGETIAARISYQITLLGRIVELDVPKP